MERKKLSITSPSKDKEDDELHLIINRKEYTKNTSTQKQSRLYDDYLPYATHGENQFITHICVMRFFSCRTMYRHLSTSRSSEW